MSESEKSAQVAGEAPKLDDAYDTYVFAKTPFEALSQHLSFGGGVFSASRNTPCRIAQAEDRQLLVAGFCVDAHGEVAWQALANYLALNAPTFDALIKLNDRLAGRYLLLYEQKGELRLLGDATSSLGIYYSRRAGEGCFASTDYLVGEACGYPVSEDRRRLHLAGQKDHPLPGTLTYFEDVSCLVPNHFLWVREGRAERHPIAPIAPQSVDCAAQKLYALLACITRQYGSESDFACPLTGGADSRLVLAFFREAMENPPCFTYQRKGQAQDVPDIAVAKRLAEKLGMTHRVLAFEQAPLAYDAYLCRYLGDAYGRGQANWAYMFKKAFPGKAIYGGGIIDQIGKAGFIGKRLPECCATKRMMCARSNMYAQAGRRETRAFCEEMGESGLSLFDQYTWEWYCARWGNMHATVYALLSVNQFNIFNCREVICQMMSVNRKARAQKKLHFALYERFDPALRSIPINPAGRREQLARRVIGSGLYQYFGVYLGYWARARANKRGGSAKRA
ncbi:MAG: asparagine synthase-related protein [Clostridia bacterium]